MKSNLLFLYISLFSANVFAQKPLNTSFSYNFFSNKNLYSPTSKFSLLTNNNKNSISKSQLVSSTFYVNNLSFFCRQELKIAKATNFKLPIAFRLGSLQYVNYLECKPNATNY
jgi:hypothetical protein